MNKSIIRTSFITKMSLKTSKRISAQKIKTDVVPTIFAVMLSKINVAINTLTNIIFSGYKMYKNIDKAGTKGNEKRVD